MDMDLNARSAKWKREQEKLKDRARRQAQTEALKRAAAAKAQAAMELVQAQKRQERLEEQDRQEQLALEEQRITGGIKYQQFLAPSPTTGDGDKITLPVSALETLNPQGAFDLGAFTFELSFSLGTENRSTDQNVPQHKVVQLKTHAGVLEFVADEGTVGLPPKVAASLFGRTVPGSTETVPAQIQVKYVRLEKGTSATLQPLGEGFGDRELDWKMVLERALRVHTTLSTGDVVLVRQGRATFEVRVATLAPEDAVSILNTDLEVALLPSEAVAKRKEIEDAKKRAEERAQRRAESRQRRVEEREQQRVQRKAELMELLTPEPPAEEKRQAKIVLRLPDGTQATRRVAHSDPLQRVWALVEAATGDASETYQLVATYPRRVFGVDAKAKTLVEMGLNGRQEALFVEKIATSGDDNKQEEEAEEEEEDVEMENADESSVVAPLPAPWQEARRMLEQQLDEALHTPASTPIHALEPILPVQAETLDQSAKWHAQLVELAGMGFTDATLNIQILERYQGRLLRVVNYLSELGASSDDTPLVEPMQE